MKSLILLMSLFFSQLAWATTWNQKLVDPLTMQKYSLMDIVSGLQLGQVVILAEEHNSKLDHKNQKLFLDEIAKQNLILSTSVAMEFFDYTKQSIVDHYTAGQLSDADFLAQVGWSGNDFNFYKSLVLFPQSHGGKTLAINLPRSVSSKIAKGGLDSLLVDDWNLLPPDFEQGRDSYKERFVELMHEMGSGHPLSTSQIDNFFEAQSSWDDTMAWQVQNALYENPSQVIVIIVGKFHAEYGGGLPDRLAARGINNILNITQIDASQISWGDLYKYIQPNAKYGPVSDLVWVQGEPKDKPTSPPHHDKQ